MAVNFLSTLTKQDIKKEQTKTNFILWNAGLVVIYVIIGAIILLIEGYFQSQVVAQQANISVMTQEIQSRQQVADQYYTLSYKLQAIDVIKEQNYLPTIITDYIESKAPAGITISSYRFLEDGGFEVAVTAQDFRTGVSFWNSLLSDKEKIRNLNLKGMSRNVTNRASGVDQGVSFTLSGALLIDGLNQPVTADGSN